MSNHNYYNYNKNREQQAMVGDFNAPDSGPEVDNIENNAGGESSFNIPESNTDEGSGVPESNPESSITQDNSSNDSETNSNSGSAMTEPEKNESTVGLVANCPRLNIRKEPNIQSEILAEVKALSNLTIDEELSTNEWYKVCTEAGIEGFCMKKFVSLVKKEN